MLSSMLLFSFTEVVTCRTTFRMGFPVVANGDRLLANGPGTAAAAAAAAAAPPPVTPPTTPAGAGAAAPSSTAAAVAPIVSVPSSAAMQPSAAAAAAAAASASSSPTPTVPLSAAPPPPSQELPWHYPPQDVDFVGRRLVPVDEIVFTDNQVTDILSLSGRDVPMMELINDILFKGVDHRNLPLVKVAWWDGAYWALENQLTFVYKHCRMGRVLVEVVSRAMCPELDNILAKRPEQYKRIGINQRSERPFPQSLALLRYTCCAWQSMMSREEQQAHDQRLENFSIERSRSIEWEDELAKSVGTDKQFRIIFGQDRRIVRVAAVSPDGTFTMKMESECGDGSYSELTTLAWKILPNSPPPAGLQARPPASSSTAQPSSGARCTQTFVVPREEHARVSRSWCGICAAEVADLKAHEESSHTEKDFCCETCSRSFKRSEDLRRHSRHEGHEISCNFSEHRGEGKRAAKQPKHEHRPQAAVPQPGLQELEDEETFVVSSEAPAHAPPNTKCGVCEEVFSDKKYLQVHQEKNHAKADFRCACGSQFQTAENLRRHAKRKQHRISIRFKFSTD
mmetsp:Transcript_18625/g.39918  ORF Transcript_18625/g.39918 Transcript_18625/m.39918 type:complete len:567 (-) Transcript_18625:53-1753(-)